MLFRHKNQQLFNNHVQAIAQAKGVIGAYIQDLLVGEHPGIPVFIDPGALEPQSYFQIPLPVDPNSVLSNACIRRDSISQFTCISFTEVIGQGNFPFWNRELKSATQFRKFPACLSGFPGFGSLITIETPNPYAGIVQKVIPAQ